MTANETAKIVVDAAAYCIHNTTPVFPIFFALLRLRAFARRTDREGCPLLMGPLD